MANLKRQTAHTVWIELRLPRSLFDALGVAYGGRNRGLGALREGLPEMVHQLLDNAPPSGWVERGVRDDLRR